MRFRPGVPYAEFWLIWFLRRLGLLRLITVLGIGLSLLIWFLGRLGPRLTGRLALRLVGRLGGSSKIQGCVST